VHSLFTETRRHYGGGIKAPRYDDVKKRIVQDIDEVINYYRGSAFAVQTQHLLCRLIQTTGVPLYYEPDRYYDVAVARHLHIANNFRLTSAISAGDIHQGVFYHGCPEILLAAHQYDIRNIHAIEDWRAIEAIKVLTTPVSNLNHLLPDGNPGNEERGLAVIQIDIPLLMLQWRGFQSLQLSRIEDGKQGLTAAHFVAQYVLPNMLKSQVEHVILNRLINLHDGAPMGRATRRHPFRIHDVDALLDRGLEELLKRFSSLPMDYEVLLSQVPVVFHDRPWMLPDVAPTRQVWWALFAARARLMEFLWEVGGPETRRRNQTLLADLKIDLKAFRSDNTLRQRLPAALYDDIQAFIRHAQ
jgi:hypothetical protein